MSDRATVPDAKDAEGAIAEAAKAYSNWGRWGEDDVLGTLNFLDAGKRREARPSSATASASRSPSAST